MADGYKRMRGGGGKESHRERLAREHRREKAKRAAQKAIEASKPGPKGWEKVGRAIVSARDKALEHPLGQAAMLLGSRGRARALPKGMGAKGWKPKPLPKWEPGKLSKGGRVGGRRTSRPSTGIERAEQAAMTRGTDPGYKLNKAKAPAPKRPGKKKTYTTKSGRLTGAQQGLHTPKTRALDKARRRAGDKAMRAAGRGLAKVEKAGLIGAPKKAQRSAARQDLKDVRRFEGDRKALGRKQGAAKKGKSFKLKKKAEAPAKGKRTKMTRDLGVRSSSVYTKAPPMKIRENRSVPSPLPSQGSRATRVYRSMDADDINRNVRVSRQLLKDVKSVTGKRDKQIKVRNPKSGETGAHRTAIKHARKRVLQAKKNKEAFDRGEKVYRRGVRFTGPKTPSKKPATATAPTKAKGKPHRGEKAPGGKHLAGPKMKPSKGPSKRMGGKVSKTAADRRAGYHKATRVPGRRSHHPKTELEMLHPQINPEFVMKGRKSQSKRMRGNISESDIANRIGPVMPGSAHFGKLSPKEFAAYRKSLEGINRSGVLKAIKKRPGLTKAQKAVLLATAATAIGAEKRAHKYVKPMKKISWEAVPEATPKLKKLPKPIKRSIKPLRKETAAEKNKRLNIRFKARPKADPKRGLKPGEMRGTKAQRKRTLEATKRKRAGQRQAEKYPPKEK